MIKIGCVRFLHFAKHCMVTSAELLGVFTLLFFLHTGYVAYVGTRGVVHQADVAMILGTAVLPSGKPSRFLKERLDAGLVLWRTNQIKYIVVTGGKSWSGYHEGSIMRDYLVASGVPADKIIVDNAGHDTWESVCNLKQLQKQYGFKSVIAVSQYAHLARTMTSLRRVGFTDVQGYRARLDGDVRLLLREFIAYYAYWIVH